MDRFVVPNACDRLVLEKTQKLWLHRERHFTHLVEEQRARVGFLEQADSSRDGVRKGAALVSEKLALEQSLWDGRAIDDDERSCGLCSPSMDSASDQLFPRSALPENQRGGVGTRDAPGEGQQLLELSRPADDGIVPSTGRPLRERPG